MTATVRNSVKPYSNYCLSSAQLSRAHKTQADVMAKARAARIERKLTPQEIARIRSLWGCADIRVSQHELARMMGISEYAVQQAIAGKTPNLYAGSDGTSALIAYGRQHCPTNQRIRAIMEKPR